MTQTLTTYHHLAASLAATSHLIASSDSSDLRPCAHDQYQINLKVLDPPSRKRPSKLPSKCVDNSQDSGLTLSFLHWKCLGLALSHNLEERDVAKASGGKSVLVCQALRQHFDKLR